MERVTEKDDGFHFDEMSDRWWETETCWFSFAVPERRLSGWIYVMARPNIGSVAGGAWVWDDTAHLPWEVLYNANYTILRLPKAKDLTDITFPTGVSVKMIEPLKKYEFGYDDGERLQIALTFDAVTPPMLLKNAGSAFLQLGHFDQIGRVTGNLLLHGESISVDCLAVRDRSWGPRPERRASHSAYVSAIASPQVGFLAVSDSSNPNQPITHGFLIRDGVASYIVEGRRTVTRCARFGWTNTIVVEGTDELGRHFAGHGKSVNHMIINRHSFIDSCSLIEWQLEGDTAWGEDQDLWPLHLWAEFRRKQNATQPAQLPSLHSTIRT